MRAFILTLSLAALGACASRPQALPPMPADAGVPAGCSPMHGGQPETPRTRPEWRTGAPLVGGETTSALVIVQVVSARDTTPVETARVVLGAPTVGSTAITDNGGHATLHVLSGKLPVLVYRIGYQRYADTVNVRGGFADTLRLGMGNDRICFY